MTAGTNQEMESATDEEFGKTAQKGWEFFTKFLLTNILVTVGALIVVGLLTVWS